MTLTHFPHAQDIFSTTDDRYSGPLVSTDHSTGDHTAVIQSDCLYGPQVIDVIMRKPGKITI